MRTAALAIAALLAPACGIGGAGDDDGDGDAAMVDTPDPTIDREEMICDIPCPPPPPIQCPQPSGDPGLPIELVPLRIDQGALVALNDGDHLPLERPIQGGQVIYVGVRARNLVDGCNVQLNGALRDVASNRVIALEQRPTYLAVGADGWAVPVVPFTQTLANVAACPQAAVELDVDGNTWQLELRLEDGARRTTVIRSVALDCGSGFDCLCDCDADYPVGPCFEPPVDAGID